MYTPEYFQVQELVPPEVFKVRGHKSWELLDSRMLETLDEMRETFGPMVVNTWHSPHLIRAYGLRQYSGLRTVEFFAHRRGKDKAPAEYAASMSQHKYGRAFDALFRDHTAAEVRDYVRTNTDKFKYLTALEDDVSWFHGDVRNTHRISVFKP